MSRPPWMTSRSRLDLLAIFGLVAFDAAAGALLIFAFSEPTAASIEVSGIWRPPSLATTPAPEIKAQFIDFETLTRPPFMKTRRPFVAKAGKESLSNMDGHTLPPGLAVKAIIKLGRSRTRIFMISTALAEGKWLDVGDTFDGWQVASVEPMTVALRSGDHVLQLLLEYGIRSADGADQNAVEARKQIAKQRDEALRPIKRIRHGAS